MDFIVRERAPSDMRYQSLGDWFSGHRTMESMGPSDMHVDVVSGNPDYTFILMIHEMIEAYLCTKRGIPEPSVRAWDEAHPDNDDPGSDPQAPYIKEHMAAFGVEAILAAVLDIDYQDYYRWCETEFKKCGGIQCRPIPQEKDGW